MYLLSGLFESRDYFGALNMIVSIRYLFWDGAGKNQSGNLETLDNHILRISKPYTHIAVATIDNTIQIKLTGP